MATELVWGRATEPVIVTDTFAPQFVIDEGGVTTDRPPAPGGTNVVANPSDDGTVTLVKLKVGAVTYLIPEGTDGTNVVANPSDPGTITLSRLTVGAVTYLIPQPRPSGSGGSAGRAPVTLDEATSAGVAEGTTTSSATQYSVIVSPTSTHPRPTITLPGTATLAKVYNPAGCGVVSSLDSTS